VSQKPAWVIVECETERQLPAVNYWFEDLHPGEWFETWHLVVTEAHIDKAV